jgi:hypothetical protein
MQTELVKTDTNGAALVVPSSVDAFAAYADAVAPQVIVGKLLKFSKGDWSAGEDAVPVPIGAKFTAAVDELMAGWVRWADGKPTDHRMVRVAEGLAPVRRMELGDTDKGAWEADSTGQPRDPWQFTNYLPLLDEQGELYTFTTSSRGGVQAIAKLSRRYATHRRRHPDVFPLIELGVGSYQHSNKEFGRIKFPDFVPAGWVPKAPFHAALAAAGLAPSVEPPAPEPDPADELCDSIPF